MAIIKKLNSFAELDKDKFEKLIESGFGKTLVSDYFSYTNPNCIYLALNEDNYLGAIVVEQIPRIPGASYLDKIVVAGEYQGNGIGKLLWDNFTKDSKKAIWRAKKENPIINFYKKNVEDVGGILNFKDITDFTFFYYGFHFEELVFALNYALNKKPTLEIKPKNVLI